jgi:hypothetical protein
MSDPINISRKEVEGKCDLKCAYNFKYTSTSGTATNSMDTINIYNIEKTSIPPVFYNKQKYNINTISIKYPSQLLYNDKLADAEISISHAPEKGGKYLQVFIPIKISSDSTTSTTEITNIIKSVSVSAPSKWEKVTISGLNLQNIVPKKPFFNFDYKGTDCIAFSYLDAIPIKSSTLDTLKQIIQPKTNQIQKSPNSGLFYNSSGPNTTTSLGDGIYISCNPTGNSTETTEVTYETNIPVYDISNILEDPTFILVVQTIIACIVFLIIFYIWNFGYKFIDGDFGDGQINGTKG